MGFFGKLFGGGNEAEKGAPKGAGMLRTTRNGGYDKSDTLTLFERVSVEKMMLEEAVEAKENGRPYQMPPEADTTLPRTVKIGGFNEEDVKNYLESLLTEIRSLREKLK